MDVPSTAGVASSRRRRSRPNLMDKRRLESAPTPDEGGEQAETAQAEHDQRAGLRDGGESDGAVDDVEHLAGGIIE